jgi:hypothetical protein
MPTPRGWVLTFKNTVTGYWRESTSVSSALKRTCCEVELMSTCGTVKIAVRRGIARENLVCKRISISRKAKCCRGHVLRMEQSFLALFVLKAIDYRRDNRRFWLSAHDCQLPTPNSQNLERRAANSDFWSRVTRELLGRLKCTIPDLQIYLQKKGKFWEVGIGDRQSMIVFFFPWVCG